MQRHDRPGKWIARLLVEGVQCDLALLAVDDERFWDDLPLQACTDDVPSLQHVVTAVGYLRLGRLVAGLGSADRLWSFALSAPRRLGLHDQNSLVGYRCTCSCYSVVQYHAVIHLQFQFVFEVPMPTIVPGCWAGQSQESGCVRLAIAAGSTRAAAIRQCRLHCAYVAHDVLLH